MTQRAGVTLVEVLVAILLTAVGLLALLVLFPVGALNMAQSIKDDRTAHAATNASVVANTSIWDVRHDSMQKTDPWPQPNPPTAPYASFWENGGSAATGAFDNPFLWGCTPPTGATAAGLPLSGPSYPVFIDPFGWRVFQTGVPPSAAAPQAQQSLALPLAGVSLIPRVMPRFLGDPVVNPPLDPNYPAAPTVPSAVSSANQNQQITRWMTSLEDLNFVNGAPNKISGSAVLERETRYSCAFIARIPNLAAPLTVDLTVLVYNKRAVQTDVNGNPVGEIYYGSSTGYTVSFPLNGTSASNVVTIGYTGTPPGIKRGSWIMDATYLYTQDPKSGVVTVTAPPTGYCYRVVNVSDPYADPSGNGNTDVDVELQTSLRNTYPTGKATATTSGAQIAVILLDDVSEVFEMGGGT